MNRCKKYRINLLISMWFWINLLKWILTCNCFSILVTDNKTISSALVPQSVLISLAYQIDHERWEPFHKTFFHFNVTTFIGDMFSIQIRKFTAKFKKKMYKHKIYPRNYPISWLFLLAILQSIFTRFIYLITCMSTEIKQIFAITEIKSISFDCFGWFLLTYISILVWRSI